MLTFLKNKNEEYEITNDKGQFLGLIKKQRVGTYLHWCFFPDEAPLGDLWFSAGCMDQIREFMKNPEKHI